MVRYETACSSPGGCPEVRPRGELGEVLECNLMARSIKFSVGEYYHVYNRGTEKRIVFSDTEDFDRFLGLLFACNSTDRLNVRDDTENSLGRTSGILEKLLGFERNNSIVFIGAYCLMPNHFHILIKEKIDGGISLFMQKLTTAYTMYFNKKNRRSGSLFQGKFKAQHANSDEYLKYLFSYIHLNSVKLIEPKWREVGLHDIARVKKFLATYVYSSYLDYRNLGRECQKILDPKEFPEYFPTKIDFEKHIVDWFALENSK